MRKRRKNRAVSALLVVPPSGGMIEEVVPIGLRRSETGATRPAPLSPPLSALNPQLLGQGGGGQGGIGAEGVFREIVHDAGVGTILFIDLQDAAVLRVASGKNARRLPLKKNARIGPRPVCEATNDDHPSILHRKRQNANLG